MMSQSTACVCSLWRQKPECELSVEYSLNEAQQNHLNMRTYTCLQFPFHLRNCPQMNNLALTCTHRQAHRSTAIIHSRFIMFLAKLLQPSLLQDILILLIFPRYLFTIFCSFLPSNIPCRFQSAVPCLINDHHCAASRKLYPKPSQNKVHVLRA